MGKKTFFSQVIQEDLKLNGEKPLGQVLSDQHILEKEELWIA